VSSACATVGQIRYSAAVRSFDPLEAIVLTLVTSGRPPLSNGSAELADRVQVVISMSVSISSAVTAAIAPEVQKSASATVASQPSAPSAPSAPADKVTLSSAAPKASPAGDVDHDGDSH
jgi:hypothetical protein